MTALVSLETMIRSASDNERAVVVNDILSDVFGGRVPIEHVASLLDAESVTVRRSAAWILKESSRLCSGSVGDYVFRAMKDSDSVVRSGAVECLRRLGDEWFVPALSTLLFHLGDDYFVSMRAAEILGLRLSSEMPEVLKQLANITGYMIRELHVPAADAAVMANVLFESAGCGAAELGIRSDIQRIALLWAVKSAIATPPMIGVLVAGISSMHSSVAVISTMHCGKALASGITRAVECSPSRRERGVKVSLKNLAAQMSELGIWIRSHLDADDVSDNEEGGKGSVPAIT
jgi:HEAT repeat protein